MAILTCSEIYQLAATNDPVWDREISIYLYNSSTSIKIFVFIYYL